MEDDSLLWWKGSARWYFRLSMGPLPWTAAWLEKPTKAAIANRPFLISFSLMSSFFMPRGSKGTWFRKPDCST